MAFKPIYQIHTILKQEYLEPTMMWAFRLVLALNIPFIILPLFIGFSYKVIWAAFGAYLLALLDYRGPHYKKITIQFIETMLIVAAAFLGIYSHHSLGLALITMFLVGMFAALIRNWNEYGASIGVAVGFFFLFGLANPVVNSEIFEHLFYLLIGALWSICLTVLSFPFKPSNPLRRSVANVWKANTYFLDLLIQKVTNSDMVSEKQLLEKELAMRSAINQSISLFERRESGKTRLKAQHYDMMMEVRKTASLFGATLSSIHEELNLNRVAGFKEIKKSVLYKLLSAYSQASAHISLAVFTLKVEEFTLAKIKVKRCLIATELFKEACENLSLSEKDRLALRHLLDTLDKSNRYLNQTILQLEEKMHFQKSDYLENYKLSFNQFLSGLRADVLLDLIREMFNINSQQFKYALRVAFGLTLGVFIYKYFNINHGYWIPLTVLIVIQPYYGATLKKSIERISGTVAGIIVGGLIMLLPIPREVYTILLIVVTFFVAYFLRNNYKVGVFFVTIMMVILMHFSQQGSLQLIGWRVVATVIGALIAIAAAYAFWPVWEKQRFPFLMKQALRQNAGYMNQVMKYYHGTLAPNESWHKHRRYAEAANNDVFACVQRMYEEPEHIQTLVNNNFALVSINIRIVREITSMALLVSESKYTVKENLHGFFKELETVYDWINNAFSHSFSNTPYPDFKKTNHQLNTALHYEDEYTQSIKTELEKIVFELEAMCVLLVQRNKELAKQLVQS